MTSESAGVICTVLIRLIQRENLLIQPSVTRKKMKRFVLEGFLAILLVPEVLSFGFLKTLLSPPMPRFMRLRNITMRRNFQMDDLFFVADFVGLVQQHGYPAEEHSVTTEDGYNLIIHRIPGSPLSAKSKRKPIVYIQHGLIASSDSWVLMGPKKDLVFLLADAGYDVWIGNVRGNTYSRSHVILSPADPEFWHFSYHEIAQYDIPAIIDYILDRTRQKSLIYIGHSMGATASYVLLSIRPEYNERIQLVISLAPVAYWNHGIRGVFKVLNNRAKDVETFLRINGIFEIAPQSAVNARLGKAFCEDNAITQPVCLSIIFTFVGVDYSQLNASLIPYITAYFPAGTSLHMLLHYHQNMITGNFRSFDYGYVDNFSRYGQKTPPDYDTKKITAPVALFYGLNDEISIKENVIELEKRLSNVITSEQLSHTKFNHIDFMWATDAKVLLYDRILELITRFSVQK